MTLPTEFADYFPFNSGAGADSYEDRWRKMARLMAPSGVDLSADEVLRVYGDTSGKQVKMTAGVISVDGIFAYNDAEQILPIADNVSGNPRIDVIVARLNWSTRNVEFDIVVGTPASEPTLPTLSQDNDGDYEEMIASVLVADSFTTINSSDVTDRRNIVKYENGSETPPGIIKEYGGATLPAGYLWADGTSYLRTMYPELFAAIGTAHGAADSNHFNVPNRRERVAIGAGAASGLTTRSLGDTGGEETHTLSSAEMPAHTHTGTTSTSAAHAHSMSNILDNNGPSVSNHSFGTSPGNIQIHTTSTVSGGAHNHTFTTASTGGGGAHNIMQPYIVMNFIIKT